MSALADRIARCVVDQYAKLPKRGKPAAKGTGPVKQEWTVLAGFVVENTQTQALTCVALGTGLKCQHRQQLSAFGDSVHDSHAEIIARRALVVYLMGQLLEDPPQSIFAKQPTFTLHDYIRLHLYSSQCPCGDAAIESLQGTLGQHEQPPMKRQRTTIDTSVVRGHQGFDTLGALRLKPGRADSIPTLSLSCSDKIARWNALGVQGSLLASLIAPVYIASMVIGDLYNHASIDRALNRRTAAALADKELPGGYRANVCEIHPTAVQFERSQTALTAANAEITTADASIYWHQGAPSSAALVNGVKQGSKLARGQCQKEKLRPAICKLSLLNQFIALSQRLRPELLIGSEHCSYRCIKRRSQAYQQAKALLLDSEQFAGWTRCPSEYEAFDCSGSAVS
ncbi:hypothetical protein IWW51_001155 [Coemansia sp. RSA 2702]|nr:hypothetical protein IWW54_001564 [Coemansia sp. RSA 2705]KAJ2319090.1 hypothetical protein IWW52_002174 [Coemansia sp. RSA 2704]KAJ2328514.1 hypothetical protein IWW51_001155 [Coemansia sp. RSA 2702]KAJ2360590.1 hypothetical protein H4S01_005665 [Coemansia sp. RSA 2610]